MFIITFILSFLQAIAGKTEKGLEKVQGKN